MPNTKKTEQAGPPRAWVLYLIECSRGAQTSLYAGITNNLQARFDAHACGKGAKYTRANRPIRIVESCRFADRASASSAEWHLKQQPRHRKIGFLAGLRLNLIAHVELST